MPAAPKISIQDIISTTVERIARQHRTRGPTLFQILRPAADYGTAPTRPMFVRRRAHTPWKVYQIKKVKPTGDGRKSRIWADEYFGAAKQSVNKKMSGVNKRGVWAIVTPRQIEKLERIYLKENHDQERWQRIVQQDDAALGFKQSIWDQVSDETDAKMSYIHERKLELLKLMKARYEDERRHKHLREGKLAAETNSATQPEQTV
eukprot:CAMPEP_0117450242 /NCGR_PEP_ID=MMETSP0759-20121206/8364_1 /TAXON_ID=63605 /ORGANISM="Percolomonas cosmopolitus, Strain WS" /LENGTH=204 /DNA_ID=CAMNT_0005242751 /DNA_START=203 /DNA_END=817 /DNA_ORIENTATION=+